MSRKPENCRVTSDLNVPEMAQENPALWAQSLIQISLNAPWTGEEHVAAAFHSVKHDLEGECSSTMYTLPIQVIASASASTVSVHWDSQAHMCKKERKSPSTTSFAPLHSRARHAKFYPICLSDLHSTQPLSNITSLLTPGMLMLMWPFSGSRNCQSKVEP